MKHDIILPEKPRAVFEKGTEGVFEIDGLYPGYGVTVGNVLRRILLSSLPGAAVTSVKIDGVQHEFSTISGIQEDVVSILLNIKRLRFIVNSDEPQIAELSIKGVKKVTAKDLKVSSVVEIADKDIHIATLTDKNAELSMELTIEKGLGYVSREALRKEKVEVGMMTLDAFFSPVRNTTYQTENMRVGDRTDFNRLRISINTDGTISPREALQQAIELALMQFSAIAGTVYDPDQEEIQQGIAAELDEERSNSSEDEEESDTTKVKVEDLRLPSRTINALHEHGIKTVGGLLRRDLDTLSQIPGVGDKAIQEIKRALGSLGHTLK